MTPNDDTAKVLFWAPRVLRILTSQLEALLKSPVAHPDQVALALRAVDRFMEVAYWAEAVDCCAEASQISLWLSEIQSGRRSLDELQPTLLAALENLRDHWGQCTQTLLVQPKAAQTQPPAALPLAVKETPVEKPAPAPTPAPPARKTPPAPAEAPNLGLHDGTFGYLRAAGVPYDQELVSLFLGELPEQLQTAERLVLALEQNPNQTGEIKNLFRILHTVKGNANFLSLKEFSQLCHHLESVLNAVQHNQTQMNTELVELLLSAVDCLSRLEINLRAVAAEKKGLTPAGTLIPVTDWAALSDRAQQLIPA